MPPITDALDGTAGRRRIYLMRHGEVRYFGEDGKPVHPKFVDLTETGRSQAASMGSLLAEVPFDRALSTGLARTIQTAEGVLAGRDIEIGEIPELKEVRSGSSSGKTPGEVRAAFLDGFRNAHEPDARFLGGDVFQDVYDRAVGAMEALLAEPGWRNLLIVAHDGINRLLLGWASHGGLKVAGAFEQDPGCLNVIDADVEDGQILRRVIKLTNLTPMNYSKLGNNLTSPEQIFDYRAQIMARLKDG